MGYDEEARVLKAHGISYAEWAVLFTASYHYPLPVEQFVEMAADEGRAGTDEVYEALEAAIHRHWLSSVQTFTHFQEDRAAPPGLVLTEFGLRIKDAVAEDLMATLRSSAA